MGCRGSEGCGWACGQGANSSNSWAPPVPEGGPVSSPSPLLGFSGPDHSCPGQVTRTAGNDTRGSHPLEQPSHVLGPQGLPRAVHGMCGGSWPQPHSSRQTSVAAFLTKSVPSKAGTGSPSQLHSAHLTPSSSTQARPAPSTPGVRGTALSGSPQEPLGEFQAPRIACRLNLASHSCSRAGTRTGRSAQNALVFLPLVQSPQPSPRTQKCLLVQAGQDGVGVGTECKINAHSSNKPKVNF